MSPDFAPDGPGRRLRATEISIRTLFMMLKGSKTDLSLPEYLVIRLQTARKTSTR